MPQKIELRGPDVLAHRAVQSAMRKRADSLTTSPPRSMTTGTSKDGCRPTTAMLTLCDLALITVAYATYLGERLTELASALVPARRYLHGLPPHTHVGIRTTARDIRARQQTCVKTLACMRKHVATGLGEKLTDFTALRACTHAYTCRAPVVASTTTARRQIPVWASSPAWRVACR